jgi:hypothetical protein
LLDQPVGQGRLPMIYVGDYAKVANKREFSHAAAPSRAAPRLQAWRKGGRGVWEVGVRDGGGVWGSGFCC